MSSSLRVVQNLYAVLGHGDVPGLLALLHDDLEWTEAERFPYYSGTWRSPSEVVEKLLVPLARDWNDFTVTPREFITEGDRVVSTGTYSATFKATGKPLTVAFAHFWTVRDGRVARFVMHVDTQKVREAME